MSSTGITQDLMNTRWFVGSNNYSYVRRPRLLGTGNWQGLGPIQIGRYSVRTTGEDTPSWVEQVEASTEAFHTQEYIL
jgi:hypothetical protein